MSHAEIPTCFACIADFNGVLEYLKFALNTALFVCHENFLDPKTGNLQEASRESVHISRQSDHAVIQASVPIMPGCRPRRNHVLRCGNSGQGILLRRNENNDTLFSFRLGQCRHLSWPNLIWIMAYG